MKQRLLMGKGPKIVIDGLKFPAPRFGVLPIVARGDSHGR